ncbi:type II CAAX endopeptidase family protein [Xanthomarina sp.]|uniref:CPBP family intramembrane glutamic endopeptidase n=1 Tax=Xanthomarina sp. TaxID=1931211 RepID=UPI002CA16733|nr:type II CAAX endopeptidase family protein [Xanthomarina sp.]HLV39606.1 type II CAAX endopeptidase family protein [Xanthomarina sp.]
MKKSIFVIILIMLMPVLLTLLGIVLFGRMNQPFEIMFTLSVVISFIVSLFILKFTDLIKIIHLKRPKIRPLFLYLIAVTLYYFLIVLVFPEFTGGNEKNFFWIRLLRLLFLAPVLEEVIFRGVAIELLLNRNYPKWGIIGLTAATFALTHLSPEKISISDLHFLAVGVLTALIYLRERNLIYSIIFHSMLNLLFFLF